MGFNHAWTNKAQEVVEGVSITGRTGVIGDDMCAVAAPSEPDAVAGVVADGLDLLSALSFACVEGRVDVDKFYRSRLHGLQYGEVISQNDTVDSAHSFEGNTKVLLVSAGLTVYCFLRAF